MFSNEYFISLTTGFLAWWLTGFYDDFIILMRILKKNNKPKEHLKIFIGQLIGVSLVLSISFSISSIFENNIWTERISGIMLILIGIWFFITNDKDEEKEDKKPNTSNLFLVAFLLYVFNATDDFTLASAYQLSLGISEKIIFCFGFLLGWGSSFFMALKTINIIDFPWLEKFAPWILITGGVLLIISTLIT